MLIFAHYILSTCKGYASAGLFILNGEIELKIDLRSYLSWDKSKYYSVSDEIARENLGLLRVISFFAVAIFGIMSILSLFIPIISEYKTTYLTFMLLCLLVAAVSLMIRSSHETFVSILTHGFQFILLFFGVVMGAFQAPEEITVTFITLIIAVPIIFTSRALYTNIVTGASIILYIVAAYLHQTPEMFKVNLLNVIPYGLVAMLFTTYFMSVKFQRFIYKNENSKLQEKNYEKTITDMIRQSGTEDDAGEILKNLLQFIGENSKSDRAYIFERNSDGNFDNTYEWCSPGILSQINMLQNLSSDYVNSTWMKMFKKSHTISITDIRNYRSTNEDIYDFLSSRKVKSLVAVAITIDGETIGFYGVDNPPKESLQYLSELFKLVEFEFAMMIRLRNRTAAIEDGALHDQLTGCKNRKALDWAYSKKYNPRKSFTIIECDLNGLKAVNDLQGHDAGDKYICGCAETFCEVFGKANVYRMGGDEFAIILTELPRITVEGLISECKEKIGERSTMGYVFVEQMNLPFEELMHQADMEMYRQKDIFYQTRKRYREVK